GHRLSETASRFTNSPTNGHHHHHHHPLPLLKLKIDSALLCLIASLTIQIPLLPFPPTLLLLSHFSSRFASPIWNTARSLLPNEVGMFSEGVVEADLEASTVSRRLVRTVSQKLRKKTTATTTTTTTAIQDLDSSNDVASGISLKCLTLMVRGGGCKVGADTDDFPGGDLSGCRRRSSMSNEEAASSRSSTPYRPICGGGGEETAGVDCFSYGVRDKFWKKSIRRERDSQSQLEDLDRDSSSSSKLHIFLPDDVLELCLVRLPLTSLMNARLVCKKWRYLTTTNRFMRMRLEGSYRNPWLFLFGSVKDGFCSGEIHAFDTVQHQWHRIEAEILKGRFMFSVASVGEDVYVVGGRSSLARSGRVDWSSFKTHKGAMVFSPLNKSWRKVASMRYARSMPVLGVSEVNADFSLGHTHQHHRLTRSRIGGVSDVYEDPHRLSLRRCQYRNGFDVNVNVNDNRKSNKFTRQRSTNGKGCKRLVLIVVGGLGSWDEPLDSGEIYDPVSNKWVEIQRLPLDFGAVSCGVVCNTVFYVYSEIDKLMGYDIEKGYWIGIQTSPFPPRVVEYYPKLVSCNDRLFMLSVFWCEGDGRIGQRNKAVRKLWELDLVCLTWSEVSVHPDAPMDWNAIFVADKSRIYGIEMFKIFGQLLDFLTVCDFSGAGTNWRHISRSHMAHELDASSCMTKSLAVVHL
ncbi:F-box/kelch-repeat protein At5g42360, partial [Linum grandiflorum]